MPYIQVWSSVHGRKLLIVYIFCKGVRWVCSTGQREFAWRVYELYLFRCSL